MVAQAKDMHSRRRAGAVVEKNVGGGDDHAKDTRPRRWDAFKWAKEIGIPLITIMATLVTGYLTVLPNLRDKDSKMIEVLQQQLAQSKEQANTDGDSKVKGSASTAKRLAIEGMALDSKTKQPLGRKEVFLIPLSNNPKLIGKTDGAGGFKFPDVPEQQYWIVVKSGNSGGGYFDQDLNEDEFNETLIRYNVKKSDP